MNATVNPEQSQRFIRNEAHLQKQILANLNLIPADATRSLEPRKWLFVQREAPILNPSAPDTPYRIDLLLADQDAIPTIVEAKHGERMSTAVRRQYTGQITDYLTSSIGTWEYTRAELLKRGGLPTNKEIMTVTSMSVPEFWEAFARNFRENRVRLILIADFIPPDLNNTIHHLNNQLRNAEAYAVTITSGANGQLASRITSSAVQKPEPAKPRRARHIAPQVADETVLARHLLHHSWKSDPRATELADYARCLGFHIRIPNDKEAVIDLALTSDTPSILTVILHGGLSYDFYKAIEPTIFGRPGNHDQLVKIAKQTLGFGGDSGGRTLQTNRDYENASTLLRWVAQHAELQPLTNTHREPNWVQIEMPRHTYTLFRAPADEPRYAHPLSAEELHAELTDPIKEASQQAQGENYLYSNPETFDSRTPALFRYALQLGFTASVGRPWASTTKTGVSFSCTIGEADLFGLTSNNEFHFNLNRQHHKTSSLTIESHHQAIRDALLDTFAIVTDTGSIQLKTNEQYAAAAQLLRTTQSTLLLKHASATPTEPTWAEHHKPRKHALPQERVQDSTPNAQRATIVTK